ncbi:MAG: hypothetical protein K9N10_10950 [Deltaproteobacteria bacterium]|nr:hypothetical protein [Deltaproteobacteria bacterium]
MTLRTRLAVFLISFAVIGLELVMMRILSLRFWYYFASMVISVGLLGFGFSGSLLTLFQRHFHHHRHLWSVLLAFTASTGVLLSAWAAQVLPLDVHYLAWSLPTEWLNILQIELLMMLPFFLTGGFLGLVLMDRPERIHGHYAANLAGSGAGAILSLVLMFHFSTAQMVLVLSFCCCGAGLLLTRWSRPKFVFLALGAVFFWLLGAGSFPSEIHLSPYKKLAQEKRKPQTEVPITAEGPAGRIDVVEGPSIHDAPPGMSLQNPHPIPKRTLVIVDGDQTHVVYAYNRIEDWRFLNYTSAALPFYMEDISKVLIPGPGGGAAIALAALHGSETIVALAGHAQFVELLRKQLAHKGGKIYERPEVAVYFELPRGYLRRTGNRYDLILIPLLDPSGGGKSLQSAQENYLFTTESFITFLRHLTHNGILSITVKSQMPPRSGLRVFNTLVCALREMALSPRERLAFIRSWESVTVLAKKSPWSTSQLTRFRKLAAERGFDMCYLPDLKPEEANRYHVLPEPFYFDAAQRLLGDEKDRFVKDYLFALEAPSDDKPYFHHFIRWTHLPELQKRLKGQIPAFLEMGAIMLASALAQILILAAVLIFLPLTIRVTHFRSTRNKGIILAYFSLLGLGFMFLEMGFLQKMILYLSHPIYSAAVVIASFLVFAGIGSRLSGYWPWSDLTTVGVASGLVTTGGIFYFFFLDNLLSAIRSQGLWHMSLFVSLAIAPLALAMGHLFPLGLKRVGISFPALVPWAWGVNGFASVIAAASAPLVAMSVGFSTLILTAIVCYGLAGLLFSALLKDG